jgi:hypothetical protein
MTDELSDTPNGQAHPDATPTDVVVISIAQARRIVALADDLEHMEQERARIQEAITRLEAQLAQARRIGDDGDPPTAIAGLSIALPPRRLGAEPVAGFAAPDDDDVPIAAGFAPEPEGGAA